jgi:hypothetical protein
VVIALGGEGGWFVDCLSHLAPLRNMKERKTL